jgi:hypothetical protein
MIMIRSPGVIGRSLAVIHEATRNTIGLHRGSLPLHVAHVICGRTVDATVFVDCPFVCRAIEIFACAFVSTAS